MSDKQAPNDDEVICPNCTHQFRAVPVAVQEYLNRIERNRDALEHDYAALTAPASTPPQPHEEWSFNMLSAPRDGTLLMLLIAPDGRANPLEDTAWLSRTVGHNNFDNDGEDKWLFAGWSWSHDVYCEGRGNPVAWRIYPEFSTATSQAGQTTGSETAPSTPPQDTQLRDAVIEECAKVCENRGEKRRAEDMYVEPDTNAAYYPSYCRDVKNAMDEEDEDCAASIRALKSSEQSPTDEAA